MSLPPAVPGERISYGDDPRQFAELRLPEGKGPHPVVIFIHGGFWRAAYDLTHASHLCAAIARAGFATWSVEYRRVGHPGGGYPGTLDDVRAAALRLTRIPGLDLQRVAAAGHSAGGQLALWLAAQQTIALRGMAALAAVTDLRQGLTLRLGGGAVADFLGCETGHDTDECSLRLRAASPIELLPLRVPQIVVHGTADNIVPFAFSEKFVKASRNAELVALPGAGHFAVIDPRAKEWSVVLESIVKPIRPGR